MMNTNPWSCLIFPRVTRKNISLSRDGKEKPSLIYFLVFDSLSAYAFLLSSSTYLSRYSSHTVACRSLRGWVRWDWIFFDLFPRRTISIITPSIKRRGTVFWKWNAEKMYIFGKCVLLFFEKASQRIKFAQKFALISISDQRNERE